MAPHTKSRTSSVSSEASATSVKGTSGRMNSLTSVPSDPYPNPPTPGGYTLDSNPPTPRVYTDHSHPPTPVIYTDHSHPSNSKIQSYYSNPSFTMTHSDHSHPNTPNIYNDHPINTTPIAYTTHSTLPTPTIYNYHAPDSATKTYSGPPTPRIYPGPSLAYPIISHSTGETHTPPMPVLSPQVSFSSSGSSGPSIHVPTPQASFSSCDLNPPSPVSHPQPHTTEGFPSLGDSPSVSLTGTTISYEEWRAQNNLGPAKLPKKRSETREEPPEETGTTISYEAWKAQNLLVPEESSPQALSPISEASCDMSSEGLVEDEPVPSTSAQSAGDSAPMVYDDDTESVSAHGMVSGGEAEQMEKQEDSEEEGKSERGGRGSDPLRTVDGGVKKKKATKRRRLTAPKKRSKKDQDPRKDALEKLLREEAESDTNFILGDLDWSGWKQAIRRKHPGKAGWEYRNGGHAGARCVKLYDDLSNPAVYEVGVQTPTSKVKTPVWVSVTRGITKGHWETAMLSKPKLRDQVDRVLHRGCKIYVRRAPFAARDMDAVYARCPQNSDITKKRRGGDVTKRGGHVTVEEAVNELRGLVTRVCDYAWKDHYDTESRTYSHRGLVVDGVEVSD